MHNRWLSYTLIGIVFGFLDWYLLDLLRLFGESFSVEEPPLLLRFMLVGVMLGINYGVWLIPVIPVSIYETRISHSMRLSSLAAALVWSLAILSYYVYYTVQLSFVGLPHLEFMLVSNLQSPTFWQDWLPVFRQVILVQVYEWIGIAVVGGILLGAITSKIYTFINQRTPHKPAAA